MPESPSYGIGEDPPDAKQHHHDGKNSKGHGMREMTEAPSITTGQGIMP